MITMKMKMAGTQGSCSEKGMRLQLWSGNDIGKDTAGESLLYNMAYAPVGVGGQPKVFKQAVEDDTVSFVFSPTKLTADKTAHCSPYTCRLHSVLSTQYSLLTTIYPLLTADHSLLTTHYSLLPIHYSLLTTHYSQLTTHYSLLTTH